jgi:hypothetical protein
MNHWLTLLVTMTDALPQLPNGMLPDDKRSVPAILEFERQLSADIDAAVRAFARQQRWPKLSPAESYYLKERIDSALVVAHALATEDRTKSSPRPSVFPNPPLDFSLDSQIEWLLIDVWNNKGRSYWGDILKLAYPEV